MGETGREVAGEGKQASWEMLHVASFMLHVCVFVCSGKRVCCVRLCGNIRRRIINWTRA